MANSIATVTSALAILKNYYEGPIVSQFNDGIPIWRELEKGKEKWNGQQVVRPVKVRRNPGIGATSDGGTLPAIGNQTTVQALIAAKYNYLRFGLTGPLIKSSQGDKGSFISAMSFEMSEGLNDIKTDVNRQISWNGNGTLATVSANAVASTVITVTGRESTDASGKFLDIGMVVDIVSSGSVVASGVQITAISGGLTTAAATLTLSSAVTTSTNDVLVRNNALNNEIQGLFYSLDGGTGTIYNVNRSTYPAFQGNSVAAASASLNFDFMQQALNLARRLGGAKIDLVLCDFDSERYYNDLLVKDKRYVGKVAGDGTFTDVKESYLEFAGVKVMPDKDSPLRFWFLDSSHIKKYILCEMEWADESGSYLVPQVSADAYEARLRFFANLFMDKPRANAVLSGYVSP